MARVLSQDPSHSNRNSHDRAEDADCTGSSWYLSRREIEENSPSRRDGIDLKKETYYRKSYCSFLQDLGKKLKVPQVTIATAIVFCHRFFLRQSLAKNDRRTIATVCMFLAGKVEETPRPLKDVILVSYEIIHKKEPPAVVQRIKQKEVYEQQKEHILLGERVVLATLAFDFNVNHPYKPLVEAIKKFKIASKELPQVAWNFVNDGLRTSLCLQFKSHHIAAGAIFLAAKLLKVNLPSDGDMVWWQEFDVTPRQLEEISNQMLELYDQNRAAPAPQGNETEGKSAAGSSRRPPVKALAVAEEPSLENGNVPATDTIIVRHGTPVNSIYRSAPDQSHSEKLNGTQRTLPNEFNDHGNKEPATPEGDIKDHQYQKLENIPEASGSSRQYVEAHGVFVSGGRTEANMDSVQSEAAKGHSSNLDAMENVENNKMNADLEKQRESRVEGPKKVDTLDEDDSIERELESGIELGAGDEKELPSPESNSRKRKAASPPMQSGMNEGYDQPHYFMPLSKHRGSLDELHPGRLELTEKGL